MVTRLATQGKKIFQWGKRFVDINELESLIYHAALSLGREIMSRCIEQADQILAEQRDKSLLRDKGYRATTIKTVMGEVCYRRHVYLVSGEAGTGNTTIYLLDKSMALDTVGFFSDTVCKMAVESACEGSYRASATALNELTGLKLSHQSVWRIVQNVGSWEQRRVEGLAMEAKAERSVGTYKTPVLYEEMDGVHLALQGKDRVENGPSKEMKVSIAYSGIYEDGSGRRRLANKVAFASIEQAKDFRRHTEGVVANYYAVNTVKRRVFNSDGDLWLQRNMVPGCTYQLDQYHRNRAVRTYLNDKDLQQLVLGLLKKKEVETALNVIEASVNNTDDVAERAKRQMLYDYFNNNRKALLPYYERPGRRCPAPNKGQKPARCGSMESNIFTIIGKRMKHNRTCWSIAGANNLAALLALHHTGRLRHILRDWAAHGSPGEPITLKRPMTAEDANRMLKDLDDYIPPHILRPENVTPAVRDILSLLPISEWDYF